MPNRSKHTETLSHIVRRLADFGENNFIVPSRSHQHGIPNVGPTSPRIKRFYSYKQQLEHLGKMLSAQGAKTAECEEVDAYHDALAALLKIEVWRQHPETRGKRFEPCDDWTIDILEPPETRVAKPASVSTRNATVGNVLHGQA